VNFLKQQHSEAGLQSVSREKEQRRHIYPIFTKFTLSLVNFFDWRTNVPNNEPKNEEAPNEIPLKDEQLCFKL